MSRALFTTQAVNRTDVPVPLLRPLEGDYDAKPSGYAASRSPIGQRVEIWRFGGVVIGHDGAMWAMGYRAYKSTAAKAWLLTTS